MMSFPVSFCPSFEIRLPAVHPLAVSCQTNLNKGHQPAPYLSPTQQPHIYAEGPEDGCGWVRDRGAGDKR